MSRARVVRVGTGLRAYTNVLRALGALQGHAGAAPGRAAGRRGAHAGGREGERGRAERGGEAHLGIRRSAIIIHRITPRARRWKRGGREGEEAAAQEKKMR
jgi:hypothetical protein